MFENNNLILFLLAGLPVLLYSLLVYWILPKKSINTRRARTYFTAGLISPLVVNFIHYIFPTWFEPTGGNMIMALLICYFFQVALFEEFAKYLTFFWVSSHRKNEKADLPIATVYYSIMSASGFAIIENIFYLMQYGQNVLLVRALTAIVLHMTCGLFMGFFIAQSKRFDNVVEKRNIFKFFKWFYIVIAIGAAALLHGFYDFNLSIPNNIYDVPFTISIMGIGLITGGFMLRSAVKDSKKIQNKIGGVIDILRDKKTQ